MFDDCRSKQLRSDDKSRPAGGILVAPRHKAINPAVWRGGGVMAQPVMSDGVPLMEGICDAPPPVIQQNMCPQAHWSATSEAGSAIAHQVG